MNNNNNAHPGNSNNGNNTQHDWKDTVRDKVSDIADDMATDVREFAQDAKEEVVELANTAKAKYEAMPTGRKMEMNHWVSLLIALAIGLIVGSLMGWSRGHHRGMTMQNPMSMQEMMHGMSASLDSLSGSDLEQEFIEQMIIHHEGAIDMSTKLVGGSGVTNDQLRAMAAGIIRAQSAEIEQLKAWQR